MRRIGEHAVVIGGNMAGLLAARALAEAYERVTVLDRDMLPSGFEDRPAIPQGRHAHALLPGGQACIGALLPASALRSPRPERRPASRWRRRAS
jgi:2-polyprenyl-6-methoxyphenol hydroxylase-like FAD-dependent oxidoreductase